MATESPREQVSELARSATEAAQQAMGRQKDAVASRLGSFAGVLRNAAGESGVDAQGVGPIAEWAAGGLERASTALRSQDLRSLLHTVEVFSRRQPVAFFLAAAAAGFLAARFIKAGTDSPDDQSDPVDMPDADASVSDLSDRSPMAPM
jgi:hypothetical protein